MTTLSHPSREDLERGLARVEAAPDDHGVLDLIVRRPAVGMREVLEVAVLDPAVGLVGDTWCERPSSRTEDRSPHPDMQLTLMSSRVVELLAGDRANWPIAGDQLYVDLDLGAANLPPGTRLRIGAALVEITDQPHTGCKKFAERFGVEAVRFISAPANRPLQMRGVNARVVVGGEIRAGDRVVKATA